MHLKAEFPPHTNRSFITCTNTDWVTGFKWLLSGKDVLICLVIVLVLLLLLLLLLFSVLLLSTSISHK